LLTRERIKIMEKFTLALTSDCTCESYDDEDNLVPNEYCYGDCWNDQKENFEAFMFMQWAIANDIKDTDLLHIGGDGIGWQRRSGYTIAQANTNSIIQNLSINGDFTLRFTLEGEELSVIRSSHDEPTGTGWMTFRLATEEEIEFWENNR